MRNFNNFDPSAWVNTNEENTETNGIRPQAEAAIRVTDDEGLTLEKIRAVADYLAVHGIDITDSYDNWFHTSMALANELGNAGRSVFHQVSRNHPHYDPSECDRKYDDCLHNSNRSISIATFFQLAKEHGVDIAAIGKNVYREKCMQQQGSATSAIMPCGSNENKNNIMQDYTSLNIETNELLPSGSLAESGGSSAQNTTAYTFSDKLNPLYLVGIFRQIYELYKQEPAKCDAMLLGAFNVISGVLGGACGTPECRSGIYGVYDGRRVFAPLYNIVYSSAGNDKGNLIFCKHLVHDIRNELRKQYEADKRRHEEEMAEYEAQKKGERGPAPKEPVYRTPIVPGNSTSAALYHALSANQGWGSIFETEADTISLMLGSEYGNYSDVMRKAHHHETLSMDRIKDNLHIEIEEPRLSVFLTCTPGQLPQLLPSFENGLGSRFLFYHIPDDVVKFHNVFAMEKTPLEDEFKKMSYKVSIIYHALCNRAGHPIQFVLSNKQQQEFLETYEETLSEQFKMLGRGIRAFIFRMALENFRIAMVLSVMRRLEKFLSETASSDYDTDSESAKIFDDMENALSCTDEDFDLAKTIVGCLIHHTARVYAVLAKEDDNNPFAQSGKKIPTSDLAVYKVLPNGDFRTNDFIEIAKSQGISERTAQRMLSRMSNEYGILVPISHGVYRKAADNPA